MTEARTAALTLRDLSTGRPLDLHVAHLIVAGYTGRDAASVQAHIDELAEQGIAPPPAVPMRYPVSADLLTTAASVNVSGARTAGEIEPVLVRHDGRWFLGAGSDHTDRELERASVWESKAACAKPVGAGVVPLPDDPASEEVDEFWDAIAVTSSVDSTPYQRGTLAQLRRPSDLLPKVLEAGDATGDLVVFAGTVPLLGGAFRFGAQFDGALELPTGQTLTVNYSTLVGERS